MKYDEKLEMTYDSHLTSLYTTLPKNKMPRALKEGVFTCIKYTELYDCFMKKKIYQVLLKKRRKFDEPSRHTLESLINEPACLIIFVSHLFNQFVYWSSEYNESKSHKNPIFHMGGLWTIELKLLVLMGKKYSCGKYIWRYSSHHVN